ncbi:MAG: rod-binding protein [Alphaproteobacteria bacterium]|nr:rod-binding protein [Alphaproteobacteria bacterium]
MASNLSPDTNIALLQATQADTSAGTRSLKAAAKARELEKVDAAAEDFEAMFIAEMMKPMFEGITTDGPFGGGKGEEIFRDLLLQEYGKIVSKTGGLGMSAEVREQMIRMQEAQNDKITIE